MKSKTKEERMIEDLRDIKEILDKHNIKFWLEYGALLGAVREGRIIPWDDDIELGMMESDSRKIDSILPEVEKKGFLVYKVPLPTPPALKLSFEKLEHAITICFYSRLDKSSFILHNCSFTQKGPMARVLWHIWLPYICAEKNIDIKMPHNKFRIMPHNKFKFITALLIKYLLSLFPYKLRKSFAYMALNRLISNNCIKCSKAKKAIVPKHYFEKFKKIEFYGMTFNIPFRAEEYLEYKYGKDWRTPRKDWVWDVNEDGYKFGK